MSYVGYIYLVRSHNTKHEHSLLPTSTFVCYILYGNFQTSPLVAN